jgi:hypothetical protein
MQRLTPTQIGIGFPSLHFSETNGSLIANRNAPKKLGWWEGPIIETILSNPMA